MTIYYFIAALLAVAASATNASALDFPVYDVEAACTARHNGLNGYNYCIKQEQVSYDIAQADWGDTTAETQRRCLYMANGNGIGKPSVAPYEVLWKCMDSWKTIDALKAHKVEHFQR